MDNEMKNLVAESVRLRLAIAQIGRLAGSWHDQIKTLGHEVRLNTILTVSRFDIIEQTCKAALSINGTKATPLTRVEVGGVIFEGVIINENPMPDFPDWVEIEIIDDDPTAARMSITGPVV